MQIFHQEKGKGAPVILIHGFCETSEVWLTVMELLADRFRVLAPDLPGFGNSPLPAQPFSLSDIASSLWVWLEGLNLKEAVIIGHSLGGYVTLAMAEQKPKALKGWGLFHSTAAADTPEKKENRNKVMAFVSANGVNPFVDTFVPGLFFQKDHPALAEVFTICRNTREETLLAYTAAMRDRPDRQNILRESEQPILVVAGEKDALIPLESLEMQSKNAKNGHFKVLRQAAHMGMYEAPDETAAIFASFAEGC